MTKPRPLSTTDRKINGLLEAARQPLSAYEILDKLRKEGLRSPPTVYRALEKLQRQGLVHRIESLGAFVACRHACKAHHGAMSPMAICASCGQVRELCAPTLARALQKIGGEFLAHIDDRVLEVTGVCRVCDSKSKPKKAKRHV